MSEGFRQYVRYVYLYLKTLPENKFFYANNQTLRRFEENGFVWSADNIVYLCTIAAPVMRK